METKKNFTWILENLKNPMSKKIYALGLELTKNCPDNDCRIYRTIYNNCCDIDNQIIYVTGLPCEILTRELCKQYHQLVTMYLTNYAVGEYLTQNLIKNKGVVNHD
jgi:hypothetical protein